MTRPPLNPMQQIVAETLAYCESHALQGAETELEVEIVRWVTGHIADAIKREYPRFNKGYFLHAANPIEANEMRDAILKQINGAS